MKNVALKIEARVVYQEFGQVVALEDKAIRVRTPMGELTAKRAASCLLDPFVADRVLVVIEQGGEAFVLAVLERSGTEAATLSVEGDLTLRAAQGRVSIAGQQGVELVSATTARIVAKTVEVSAIEILSVLSGVVKAEFGRVKTYAASVESFFERVRQHTKYSHRIVEELDQVNARHIDYAAHESAQLHGENTLVTAEQLVKVNGEQVHVG